MPFYYDIVRATTTNVTPATESQHLRVATVANQDTCTLRALYGNARNTAAGGLSIRLKSNTGTAGSGGTAQTPGVKAVRGAVAAQTTVFNDATALTPGTTLVNRASVGAANTGGQGGWSALEAAGTLSQSPNATNPINTEVYSIAAVASIAIDVTLEFAEGA